MLGLEDWPYISSNPQIGSDIFDLVVNGKGSKQARKIYYSIRSQ